MRILLTTDTVGGVWTFTRELTSALLSEGHSVALVSMGREPSAPQRQWAARVSAARPEAFSYEASAAPLEWMEENVRAYDEAASVLLATAESFHPDLLHSNQFCFGKLPLGSPRIVTAHSDVFSWADACRPGGLPPSAWLSRYRALVEEGIASADAITAPTRWMLETLRINFRLRCPATVIHNGRTVKPSAIPCGRRLQAASAGRIWDEAKGLDTLARISSPIPIFIAGEDSFEHSATRFASPSIYRLGVLAEDDLCELFTASAIYIVTSIYEPFGFAPLEAALCGCAIVARDLPSLREIWGDAAVYFNDDAALERTLLALNRDHAYLRAIARSAQRRAQQFTAQRMAAQYVELYRDLLKSPHSAPQHEPAQKELAAYGA